MRRRNSVISGLIIGPLFAVIGYFVAFSFGKPILENARASEAWPNVAGVVESSEVVRSRNSDGKTMYGADVVYAYEVEGREYSSNQISFGGASSSSSSSGAYRVVNHYNAGNAVTVTYDPERPEVAVLEPGVTWSSYMVYGIGWVFFGVGLLVTLGVVGKIAFVMLALGVAGRS